MHHSVFGRKLSRSKNQRRRLLQGLARDLIIHGQIKTTVAKAKAVAPMVEKLITKAKDASQASKNEIRKVLADKRTETLLAEDAKTRFASRVGGYTRIVRLGKRLGDATEEVYLSFVDARVTAEVVAPVKAAKVETKKVETKKSTKAKSAQGGSASGGK